MSCHPNWQSLSTVKFRWKSFVQASNELTVSNVSVVAPHLKKYGQESQAAYEEVLSSVPECTRIGDSEKSNRTDLKLKKRTRVNISGTCLVNLLMKEAASNNVKGLTELLEGMNDLNVRDQYGWTMLMCASHAGAVDVVKYLLDENASTSIKDKSGYTCISLAKRQKHYDIIKLLENQFQPVNEYQSSLPETTRIFCDICKQYFEDSSSNPHKYSTVHLFNTHPRKSTTWYGIPDTNKGFELMIKSGWNRDNGLGPQGSGIKVPCKTVFKTDRQGLGTKGDVPRVTHFKPFDLNAISSSVKTNKQEQPICKSSLKSKIVSEKRRERILRKELNF